VLKVHPKLVEQLVAQAMAVQEPPSAHAPVERAPAEEVIPELEEGEAEI
jgi:hypothetical protein